MKSQVAIENKKPLRQNTKRSYRIGLGCESKAFFLTKLFIITLVFSILHLAPSRLEAQSISWKTITVPNYKDIKDVSFSGNLSRYVAVGPDSAIYWSDNGLTWNKAQNFNIQCDLNCTAYAFGKFYAGGKASGKAILLESEDGKVWFETKQEIDSYSYYVEQVVEISELETVLDTDGRECLVSVNYGTMHLSKYALMSESLDGNTWKVNSYDDGKINGIFSTGIGYIYKNYDEGSWNTHNWLYRGIDSLKVEYLQNSYRSSAIPDSVNKFAYGNGTYVGTGKYKTLGYLDHDKSWVSSATTIASTDFTGVAFGNGYFVAVGTNGAAAVSYDDGRSWVSINEVRNAFNSLTINGVDYLNDRFIVYGDGGGIAIGTPVNNREWGEASMPSGAKSITAIAVSDQRAVAVSLGGKIYHSTNGQNWTLSRPVTSNNLNKVIFDSVGKVFIASGEKGTVLRSSDGISWSSSVTGSTSSLQGAARLGKSLYAMGPANAIMESTNNAATWRRISSTQVTRPVVDVSSSSGILFAVADRGTCFVSNKGNDFWRARPITGMAGGAFGGAVYNGDYYIVGEKGQMFSTKVSTAASASRVTWKKVPTNTTYNLRDAVPNGDSTKNGFIIKQFAVVGDKGTIYRNITSQNFYGPNLLSEVWKIERIDSGLPQLNSVIWYSKGKVWLAAGVRSATGVIYFTNQN